MIVKYNVMILKLRQIVLKILLRLKENLLPLRWALHFGKCSIALSPKGPRSVKLKCFCKQLKKIKQNKIKNKKRHL